MEEIQCIQTGNRLEVELQVSRVKEFISIIKSREYSINGLVVFQVKINISRLVHSDNTSYTKYNASVNITLRKALKTDTLTYAIKCYCSEFKMSKPIILVTDDTPWRQMYEYIHKDWTQTFEIKFKLALELDLQSSSSSPLASLHNDTDLTDFELRGKDGSVHVHKVILAGYSPVLRSLVAGDWREAKEGSVNVEGTTKETLQHLKDYMYHDKLPENGLKQLITLASYYMMEDLVQKCSFKLLIGLSAHNALELADIAATCAGTYKMRYMLFGLMQDVKYDDITFENMENLSLAEKSADTENDEDKN